MVTVTAKPGVSPSSAQSAANRVSQDIAGASNPNWSPSGGGGSGGGSSASSAQNAQDYLDKYIAMIKSNVAENNAWSAEQAKINRDWQERMSNTAHQREVADLKKAGLNPVLSAMSGNGAATTSGATASTDTSANTAITNLLGAMISSLTQQENARLSAQTNLAVAEKYNAMSKYTAELQSRTQLTTTNIQTAASKWIAELQAKTSITNTQAQVATSKIVANIQAAAQRYGYNIQSWTSTEVARLNNETSKELKEMGIEADFKVQDTELQWKDEHPSTLEQAGLWYGKDLIDAVLNGSGLSGSAKSFADGARGGGFSGFR